jgi:hypothetical protein
MKENPNYDNLYTLISRYAKLGLKDKGISAIKENIDLLNDKDNQYGEEFCISSFEQRLNDNGF